MRLECGVGGGEFANLKEGLQGTLKQKEGKEELALIVHSFVREREKKNT